MRVTLSQPASALPLLERGYPTNGAADANPNPNPNPNPNQTEPQP